jgi:large subunit ribosomal protein L29
MKTEELKQKTMEDLKNLLQEKKEKLTQLRFDLASGKVKNVREIRMVKKDIARIMTLINQKSCLP